MFWFTDTRTIKQHSNLITLILISRDYLYSFLEVGQFPIHPILIYQPQMINTYSLLSSLLLLLLDLLDPS